MMSWSAARATLERTIVVVAAAVVVGSVWLRHRIYSSGSD